MNIESLSPGDLIHIKFVIAPEKPYAMLGFDKFNLESTSVNDIVYIKHGDMLLILKNNFCSNSYVAIVAYVPDQNKKIWFTYSTFAGIRHLIKKLC